MGLKQLDLSNHILVIGWDQYHTKQLLHLLHLEAQQNLGRDLCLCATDKLENPLPGVVEFVSCQAYNNAEDMARACVDKAATIIIDTSNDETTMTAALYCYSKNPQAHIIVYLRDESLGELIKAHCPTVECTPSVSKEMIVKAAMDPGSSFLHQELLNASQGMTQYSIAYPADLPKVRVGDIYFPLKKQYDAALIAVDFEADGKPETNPALDEFIQPNTLIYYIANRRILDFDWQALLADKPTN